MKKVSGCRTKEKQRESIHRERERETGEAGEDKHQQREGDEAEKGGIRRRCEG